jgi:hypothetical protein
LPEHRCVVARQQQPFEFIAASSSEEALLRIIGPNFSAVLRLRGGAVAEAARPVSYMKG